MLIGMLPPFHSFGITVTTDPAAVRPACGPSTTPTRPRRRCWRGSIDAYRVTLLVGTPTFLQRHRARGAAGEQLDIAATRRHRGREVPRRASTRRLRSGCPRRHRSWKATASPSARRSCRPTGPEKPVPGSIGPAAPSVEGAVVGLETRRRRGRRARPGCCSCAGRASSAATCTTQASRRSSSSTGSRGIGPATWCVRTIRRALLRRPAEAVRQARRRDDLAARHRVGAAARTSAARPTKVRPSPWRRLARRTARDRAVHPPALARDQVNQWIRDAGLSPLHNVRQVIGVAAIPVLGTGKTDYRGLKESYREGQGQSEVPGRNLGEPGTRPSAPSSQVSPQLIQLSSYPVTVEAALSRFSSSFSSSLEARPAADRRTARSASG